MLQVIHRNKFKTMPANRKMSFDTLALKSSGIVDPAEQQAYVIPKLKDKSWCFHRQPAIYCSTKIQHGSIAWDHHFSHLYIFLIVTLFLGWDPHRFSDVFLCFLHLTTFKEELNTTEHKLLYDYLHFLTLQLHLVFWGGGCVEGWEGR